MSSHQSTLRSHHSSGDLWMVSCHRMKESVLLSCWGTNSFQLVLTLCPTLHHWHLFVVSWFHFYKCKLIERFFKMLLVYLLPECNQEQHCCCDPLLTINHYECLLTIINWALEDNIASVVSTKMISAASNNILKPPPDSVSMPAVSPLDDWYHQTLVDGEQVSECHSLDVLSTLLSMHAWTIPGEVRQCHEEE